MYTVAGTIRTPRTERIWAHVPDHFDQMAEAIPMQRLGEPLDVTRAFKALALELTHIDGQVWSWMVASSSTRASVSKPSAWPKRSAPEWTSPRVHAP